MVISDSEEDAEESSSSSPQSSGGIFQMKEQFQSALDEFRENWQNELKSGQSDSVSIENSSVESDEIKAERLFKHGIDLEQRGKVYDAMQFYRKAVQIVPDIEFRIYESTKNQNKEAVQITKDDNLEVKDDLVENSVEEENLDGVDLCSRFQSQLGGRLILSSFEGKVVSTQLHISNLPIEIILYILRWVISNQLDMSSLEQLSATCKGLYLCARDEEIWRRACLKVWGANANSGLTCYKTWRRMFIERERILFSGCYISKTSYLRYGENSFQDEFYRPIQLIMYYRYKRFLPDGTVLMMTSSDEPQAGVNKLKPINNTRPDVLKGHWRLHGNIVIIVCQKNQSKIGGFNSGKRRNSMMDFESLTSTTYYMELVIANSGKRKFCQLQWKHYSMIQKKGPKKIETTTKFDLTTSKFPPLFFSRVKSYHLDATAPL